MEGIWGRVWGRRRAGGSAQGDLRSGPEDCSGRVRGRGFCRVWDGRMPSGVSGGEFGVSGEGGGSGGLKQPQHGPVPPVPEHKTSAGSAGGALGSPRTPRPLGALLSRAGTRGDTPGTHTEPTRTLHPFYNLQFPFHSPRFYNSSPTHGRTSALGDPRVPKEDFESCCSGEGWRSTGGAGDEGGPCHHPRGQSPKQRQGQDKGAGTKLPAKPNSKITARGHWGPQRCREGGQQTLLTPPPLPPASPAEDPHMVWVGRDSKNPIPAMDRDSFHHPTLLLGLPKTRQN